jgi:UDP-GlcNAc3NAcA epimerase
MLLPPQGFATTQALLEYCHCVFSDSGGLLREAYFAGRYCVIPWEYAAWPELVEAGWADSGPLIAAALRDRLAAAPGPRDPEADGLFGAGDAGVKIARLLLG